MFKFLKRPALPDSPLEQVKYHLKTLGYALSEQGTAAAQLQLDAGMSPISVAVHFAVITMADNLRHAGAATTGILRFRPQAMELLEKITQWKEEGILDATSWQPLYESIIGISSVNEQQASWIEQVLRQPAARHIPLAHHLAR